jgi:hypothetical protein
MNLKSFIGAAGALGMAFALFPAATQAQGPLYDKVIVNLPYTVTVGDHTLQPGPYVIRQENSPGADKRRLLIYSDDGHKYETSAVTIATLDNHTAANTTVVLHHFGPDYYFDRIWVQGRDYGYEFPLPASVKARERERMAPLTVAATYEAVPAPVETAQAPPPAPPEEAPAPAPPPEQPAPAPAPEVAQAPPPPQMPVTSANWLMMLLGGGTLSGLGLAVRRRK